MPKKDTTPDWKKRQRDSGSRFIKVTQNPDLATHPKGHKYRATHEFVGVTRGGSKGGKDGANDCHLKKKTRQFMGPRSKLVPFAWPPGVTMPHLAKRK